MADINQTISLGIGSPASIKFFITVGLGIQEVSAVADSWSLISRSTAFTVSDVRDITWKTGSRSTSWTIKDDDR